MSLKFQKDQRLRKRFEFQKVLKVNRKWSGKWIHVSYMLGNSTLPRLGITTPSRFGKAFVRNRFKRIVREAFRFSSSRFPHNLDIIVLPTSFSKEAKKQDIEEELSLFLQKNFLT